MSNITPQGWESQSVERIVEELIARAEADYGTSFPTTPDSFAGQFFNIMAAQEKKIQDLGQAITSTQNLSTCSGIYLDYIADHKNTRRFRASGSYGKLLITGNQGLPVSLGTPFKDVTSRTVLTTEDLTLNRASCYSGTFTINTVSDSTDYSITIEGQEYTYNSGISATEVTILQGLESSLTAGSSVFTTAVVDSSIVINSVTRSNILTLANSLNIQLESIGSLVSAEAITLGPEIYPTNSITTVVINSLNIDSVTNPFDFTVGRFEELKKCCIELGGKDALIICEDADLDRAAQLANFGSFMHQGQICMSVEKLLVHEKVYEPFLEKFKARAAKLKVGNPLQDPQNVIGPLINDKQAGNVRQQIEDAVAKGRSEERRVGKD